MKKHLSNILFIVGAIIVAGFLYNKYRVPPTIEFQKLTLIDLEENKVQLQDYAGKNIFITMWAPWCRDCLVEMPDLQFVKNQLKDDNFVFLAISGYNFEQEKAYASKMPYDFTYLHMSEKLKEIGVHAIPTNYIINSKGKVVYEKVGAEATWRSEATIDMVRELVQ